jgi:hypothetical protein
MEERMTKKTKKVSPSGEIFDDKVERMIKALGGVIGDEIGFSHVTLALDHIMRNHMRMVRHLEMAEVPRKGPEVIWH